MFELSSDFEPSPVLLNYFDTKFSVFEQQVFFICVHFMSQISEIIWKSLDPVLKKPSSVNLSDSNPIMLDKHLLSSSKNELSEKSLNFGSCFFSLLSSFLNFNCLLFKSNVEFFLILCSFKLFLSVDYNCLSMLRLRLIKVKLRVFSFSLCIGWSWGNRKRVFSIRSLTQISFLNLNKRISWIDIFHLSSAF